MMKIKFPNLLKTGSKLKMTLLTAAIFFNLFFYSCKTENENSGEVNTGTPVKITHPFITSISQYVELNGTTVYLSTEIVRTTFQGYIEKVYKNIGDNVSPGENLLQVKTLEFAAAESLMISLGVKQFKGMIDIKSKSVGVLTSLFYHPGDFVSNGEQIAAISNPSSIRVKLNVPYEDVQKIKVGSHCEILLSDGENISGTVEKSIPSVDSITQTQTYFIKVNANRSLPENLNVSVRIPFRQIKDALVLPKNSVTTNVTQDSFWVMKLVDDTTAVKVNIQKGIENDSIVQLVNTSLKQNDRIILIGAYGLPDTVKVDIEK